MFATRGHGTSEAGEHTFPRTISGLLSCGPLLLFFMRGCGLKAQYDNTDVIESMAEATRKKDSEVF